MFEMMNTQKKMMEVYAENVKKMNNNYTEMYKLMQANVDAMKEMTEEMIKASGLKELPEMPELFDISKMFEVKMPEMKMPGMEEYTKMCEDWYTQNKKMMEDMFAKYMPKDEKTEKKNK